MNKTSLYLKIDLFFILLYKIWILKMLKRKKKEFSCKYINLNVKYLFNTLLEKTWYLFAKMTQEHVKVKIRKYQLYKGKSRI